MMEKMIFGRYVPAKSILHQMDPRAKLLFIFGFICVVFLANNAVTYALLGLFTFSALILSNLSIRFIIGGLETHSLADFVYVFLTCIFYKRRSGHSGPGYVVGS